MGEMSDRAMDTADWSVGEVRLDGRDGDDITIRSDPDASPMRKARRMMTCII